MYFIYLNLSSVFASLEVIDEFVPNMSCFFEVPLYHTDATKLSSPYTIATFTRKMSHSLEVRVNMCEV